MLPQLSLTLLGATGAASMAVSRVLPAIQRDVVEGKSFDRFIQIFLENQDFVDCIENEDFQYLASQGITLTNFYATTHPSQPNYIAAVGGDTNGADSNDEYNFDESVKTVVDLLEDAGVSWGVYQEHMPETGFTGDWPNQETGADDYRRKHNPVISYKSITSSPDRLSKIRNFTLMHDDVASDTFPQWSFLTPNMTNDGHDTTLAHGASWSRTFLDTMLATPTFNTPRTLLALTYDEGSYSRDNRVLCILLGGAVPESLHGTEDDGAYSHYSLLKTVEENWGLGDLGKGDADAAAFF